MKDVPTIEVNGREIGLAVARSIIKSLQMIAEENQAAMLDFIRLCHDSEHQLSPDTRQAFDDRLLLNPDGSIHPDVKAVTGKAMGLVNGKITINDFLAPDSN